MDGSKRLATGKDVSPFLSKGVLDYIFEHGLYGCGKVKE